MFAVFKGTIVLAGECKFSKEPVEVDALEDLDAKATNFHGDRTIQHLFARDNFTEVVKIEADIRDDLHLIITDDLYKGAESKYSCS